MLLEELAPLLSGLGLRTDPDRLAVVATSPAVAPTGPEVTDAGQLSGMAVRVDCGANDSATLGGVSRG